MNVASLQNCRELFELSGWHGGEYLWCDGQLTTAGKLFTEGKDYWEGINGYPAYDSGFLLRKLPDQVNTGGLEIRHRGDTWIARYGHKWFWASDGNIENCLCKLAIELFKQGVLMKGGA